MNDLATKAEYDAQRFSEFCLCDIEDARKVIALCRDYAADEKEYWQNIDKAVTRWQSQPFPVGERLNQLQALLSGVKELPSLND